MSLLHLPKRFFTSLRPKALTDVEKQWVQEQLLESEQVLFFRFGKADQRHSYLVARRAEKLLAEQATRPVLAAALLHDIGKIDANIGTGLRVVATLVGTSASRQQIDAWAQESGWLGRAGQYLRHNEIGADMLTEAGSDPLTIAWCREHELVHTEWTLPEHISDALYKADNI